MDIASELSPDLPLTQAPINWSLLGEAVAFYRSLGYQYVEAPWGVTADAILATLPPHAMVFYAEGLGHLVGSAEQSLVMLDLAGKLGTGRFVACTPCFRDEPVDRLHQQTFMKVELYDNELPDTDVLAAMLGQAIGFFRRAARGVVEPKAVRTAEGWDIEINGVEVGSYGIRSYHGITWVYGTALAEPRFSAALAKKPG